MSAEWSYLKPSMPLRLEGESRIQRIGLFKFRNIGDVLLMTPAIRSVREAFPRAKITAVVNSVTDAMLQGNPHLDEILVYDRSRLKGFRRLLHEYRFFREVRRRRFDLTLNLVSGERPAWCALFSGATWRVSYYNWWPFWSWVRFAYTHIYRYPRETVHQVPFQYNLLQHCGITTPAALVPSEFNRLVYHVAPSDRIWAEQFLFRHGITEFVHIHPVSRWLFKCWDDLRMAQLIDWIQETLRIGVVLTCGPETREREKAQRILDLCRVKPLSLMGEIGLNQAAALIEKADLFLGVDTAPMHLAAALGRPVIALFGPSGQGDWAPWTEDRVVLDKGCPCGANLREGCDHYGLRACMKAISLEEVKETVERVINRRRNSTP